MKIINITQFPNNYAGLFRFLLMTLVLLAAGCTSKSPRQYTVNFVVHATPQSSEQLIYLTGNHEKLGNWNTKYLPLDKFSDSIWQTTLTFNEGEKLSFKVTAGSWWAEALDEKGQIYPNQEAVIRSDTVISFSVFGWLNEFTDGKLHLNAEQHQAKKPVLRIDDDWLFMSGDSAEWAKEAYDDSRWRKTNSYIDWDKNTGPKWEGIGWFRFHVTIDSTLWNRSFGMLVSQLGASEFYYNGRLIYTIGKIGNSKETTQTLQNRLWKELKFDPKPEHVLAVRYANYDWKKQQELGFSPGFNIFLKDIDSILESVVKDTKSSMIQQMVFTAIPLILALLHLLLFSFYRRLRQNLFFAISLIGFAGINYFGIQKFIETNPDIIILFYQVSNLLANVAIFFSLLTNYAISYEKLPRRWIFFGVLSLLMTLAHVLYPVSYWMGTFNYALMIIVITEIILSNRKSTKPVQKGTWIIRLGFMLLGLFVVWQILIDYQIIEPWFEITQVWVYGMLSISLAMSIFLSYSFSTTNLNLEAQLAKVQELSEQAVEQARKAGKLELERRVLEMESERKSAELESARQLQLSLLPKTIPQSDSYDIACFMNTATEVGGDYYDFYTDNGDDLTIITGDATGHGLKAGNMVFVTKGILNTLLGTEDLSEILKRTNHAIKKMNLSMLNMGLALLRIRGNKVSFSSAGMPPLVIYRKATNIVEQCVIKAMPLGAFFDFPYTQEEIAISSGDILLLMSDGLPDAFDEHREVFSMDRVNKTLLQAAHKDAEAIVGDINAAVNRWRRSAKLQDDLMLVVVKVK